MAKDYEGLGSVTDVFDYVPVFPRKNYTGPYHFEYIKEDFKIGWLESPDYLFDQPRRRFSHDYYFTDEINDVLSFINKVKATKPFWVPCWFPQFTISAFETETQFRISHPVPYSDIFYKDRFMFYMNNNDIYIREIDSISSYSSTEERIVLKTPLPKVLPIHEIKYACPVLLCVFDQTDWDFSYERIDVRGGNNHLILTRFTFLEDIRGYEEL